MRSNKLCSETNKSCAHYILPTCFPLALTSCTCVYVDAKEDECLRRTSKERQRRRLCSERRQGSCVRKPLVQDTHTQKKKQPKETERELLAMLKTHKNGCLQVFQHDRKETSRATLYREPVEGVFYRRANKKVRCVTRRVKGSNDDARKRKAADAGLHRRLRTMHASRSVERAVS
jgi:hypothetical protein